MPNPAYIQLGDVIAARSIGGIDVAVVVEFVAGGRLYGLRWDDYSYSVEDLLEGSWEHVVVNERSLRHS